MTLAYIDPGTGAMMFSLATGLLSALWFGVRKLYLKLKYLRPGSVKVDKAKKDIVIYSEDKRYWTTFKGILDEFERREVKVTYLAGSEDDPLLSMPYKHVEMKIIGLGNKAYARLNLLNARICLATTPGLGVYQWKRSKSVDWYVHITHAIGGAIRYRMFGTQFFDAILYSSDFFTPLHREIEKKRGTAPKEIVSVGQTYMDYLLERKAHTPAKRHEGVAVLVAPSWGASNLLNRFGDALIDSLIATGFDITLRPHPQSFISEKPLMQRLQAKYPEGEHFHWNRDADNFNVLNDSDIMISDFSGVILDFAFGFAKPVICAGAQPDSSVMDEVWLDKVYDVTKLTQRICRELQQTDIPSIGKVITNMIADEKYKASVNLARDDYWQHRGHAAERVVDYLEKKCKALSE